MRADTGIFFCFGQEKATVSLMQWKEFQHHVQRFTVREQTMIQRAYEIGALAHATQKRKSGEPYFMHPIAVAHMLADMGADADTVAAALLHDTVEDTNITLESIEAEFGPTLAELIDGVTKLTREDLEDKQTLDEQIETLRKLFNMMRQDVRVIVIKLIDRLHNMQTVEFLSDEKRKKMAKETLDVHVKIAERLAMYDVRDELEALCLSILEPDTYAALTQLRTHNEKLGKNVMKKMEVTLQNEHIGNMQGVEIVYERKTWDKLRQQLMAEGAAVTGLSAITVVFICPDIDGCYRIIGALHQSWKRETLSFQDYINSPRLNGYRGLHTTVILEDGTRVRCKIRTQNMHEYAHKGITLMCFGENRQSLLEKVPWAQRITTMANDTKHQSQEFWDNLQSDILGEFMVIHGPADQTVSLPKDGTALDAAFYLLGDKALRVRTIRVNGQSADLSQSLKHGDSLDLELGDVQQKNRAWLNWVHTGFATAVIRKALADAPNKEKIATGKKMLQEEMLSKHIGYIKEFNLARLDDGLRELGYDALEAMLISIADGHLEPGIAVRALFGRKQKAKQSSATSCVIQFCINLEDIDSIARIIEIYKKYDIRMKNIRLRPLLLLSGIVRVGVSLSPEEQRSIVIDLRAAGATDVLVQAPGSTMRFYGLVSVLLIVWGLDPVVAAFLIRRFSLSTIDLTLVRFWSLTCMSALLLIWTRLRGAPPKTPLPLRKASLWLSVLLLIIIALSTYAALAGTQPIHYSIPMTAGGLLLTSIVNRKRKFVLLFTWLLLVIGVGVIVFFIPDWNIWNIISTLVAVISFSGFSVISERYKREENVGARSAQYFFVLSFLCALLTLPIVFFSTLSHLSLPVVTTMVGFSIVFAGLPYYIYYHLLSHREIDFVLRFSFLIIYTTLAGQLLFLGTHPVGLLLTLVSAFIVTAGAVLPLIRIKQKAP